MNKKGVGCGPNKYSTIGNKQETVETGCWQKTMKNAYEADVGGNTTKYFGNLE